MSDLETKLTAKQEGAIVGLLSSSTLREAARHAHVGESTLARWLTLSAFRSRYESERRQLFDAAKTSLRRAALGAVDTLIRVQSMPDAPPHAQVSAAKAILDMCLKIQESDDILIRLDAWSKGANMNAKARLMKLERAMQVDSVEVTLADGRKVQLHGDHLQMWCDYCDGKETPETLLLEQCAPESNMGFMVGLLGKLSGAGSLAEMRVLHGKDERSLHP